nr:F-box domain-containing protein [Pithovirus mammoth]
MSSSSIATFHLSFDELVNKSQFPVLDLMEQFSDRLQFYCSNSTTTSTIKLQFPI